ncbi:hypothetical protein L6452_01904 [Arctium lappa]|uniref:Uncharacterized protein n=1 Tax=Arctium lappa TaxID=4217 RepID=A0ACB9FIU4_ARCLA|nr:hypothetical protein L6452_01904 [Arctium lappa]
MKRASPKPKPEPSTSDPLEFLHMDLWGPMQTQSINGKKYVLVIVDDYSRYTWVKFLRSNDETPEIISSFLKSVEMNMQKTVKCYVLNDMESLNKFNPKAKEGIFIGYSQTSASYRVYMKTSKIVVESVNVKFDEAMEMDS